ncbi:hypothetical protein BGZ92_006018, partial [Podila epicladia]
VGSKATLCRTKLSDKHRYPMAQARIVDLTLVCGVDEMSGLGKLELTVGAMTSDINIPELEWIAQYWSLKTYVMIFHDSQPVKPGMLEFLTANCKEDEVGFLRY